VYELVLNQHDFFKSFLKNLNVPFEEFNIFSPTISLLSLNLWKLLSDNKRLIEGVHSNEEYLILRDSYKGGMCVPLKKVWHNKEHVKFLYHYDIVSSYPNVMYNFAMPIRRRSVFVYNPPLNSTTYKFTPYCLYKVRFRFKDHIKFPYFPLRTKNGLVYVQTNFGEVDCCWIWGHELIFATSNRHLSELLIYEHWLYTTEHIFQDYIGMLFKERVKASMEKNEIKKFWLKILMNSLYGKFGQRQFDKINLVHGSELHEYLSIFNDERNDQNQNLETQELLKSMSIISENIHGEPFFQFKYTASTDLNWIGACVAISSFIASQARLNLVMGMFECGLENIYYFDTDSIFSSAELPKNLLGDNLGQWKCEEEDIVDALFIAPKVYCFRTLYGKEVLHCKGIPTDLLKWQDFELMLSENTFRYTIKTQFFHKNHEIFVKENLEKILNFMDSKRNYDEQGESSPWNNLKEMEEFINNKIKN
jgi:hypothetical protein